MLRKMQAFVAIAALMSCIGGGLAFAQGASGTLPEKMMHPSGGEDKMGTPAGKAGLPMDKAGMGKTGMPMEKSGMGMDKAGMAGKKTKSVAAPIDINTADEASLKTLQGLGPAKAKAIVAYRQQHGPFKNLDELEKVPGIGKKNLAGMKDQLILGKGL